LVQLQHFLKAQTAHADGNRFSAPTAQNGTGVAVLEPGNCHPPGIRRGAFERQTEDFGMEAAR